MLPFPAGRPIDCCVEVPEELMAPARHGLEVLLTGLGLVARWSSRADLPAGGIYYGSAPEEAPAHAVRLRMDPSLVAERPFAPADVGRLDWQERGWPLLHPSQGAFGTPTGGIEDPDVVASAHDWTSGKLEAQVVPRDIHARLRDDDAPPAQVARARPDLADPTIHPPVDAYRDWLAGALERAGTSASRRTWDGHAWAAIPTADVDIVRTRRPGAWLGDDPRRRRLAELTALLARDGGRSTYFIKAAATSDYDVEYPLDHPALEPVWAAARLGQVELGLHPSYFSHDHTPRLASERNRLASAGAAAGAPPAPFVRTHFLRWVEPGTPRSLAGAGFVVDSTLGFAGRAGFRRGTAVPFRLFDLLSGRALDMWEVPLCAMDTALFVHGGSDGQAALRTVDAVLAGARDAGGAGVLLWHNEPIAPDHLGVLDMALRHARAAGALVDSLGSALRKWQ